MNSLEISTISKSNIFKIVIGGDGGCGKSTLIATKRAGEFHLSSNMTIGVDFEVISLPVSNHMVHLQVWDLGGQDRFQFVHSMYMKGAKGGVILYDLTRPQTFEHLLHWIELYIQENPRIPLVIAGTKKDLVTSEDLLKYTTRWMHFIADPSHNFNIVQHLFISSKNLEGIHDIFQVMAQAIIANQSPLPAQKAIISVENSF